MNMITASLRECVVCRTSCQLTPLNNEMRPELAEFFTPLSKNMENFYQVPTVLQILYVYEFLYYLFRP